MKGRIHVKSIVAGAGLAGLLLALAGAAGGGSSGNRAAAPASGRFQIACTNTLCYLVDSATGDVWMTGDPGFWESKLEVRPTEPGPVVQGFVGQWAADDPNSAGVTLQVEPDGSAVATDGVSRFEGRWAVEGTRMVLSLGDEAMLGEILPDGRLVVTEPGNAENRVTFKKAPQPD